MTVSASHRTISLIGYNVTIGAGLLDRLGEIVRSAAPAHRMVVVTDSTVRELYAERAVRALGAGTTVLSIPPGEREKTRERWAQLTDSLLASGCGRDTTLVALGGGVIGDLTGFVAATYMRGIPYVQVPTTLLAMVDASVGGKTAIDVAAGKNLVGAFHPPAAVVADVQTLATLPARQLRAGMAEVLKHGIIADAEYFEQTIAALLTGTLLGQPAGLGEVIARSVEIKSGIVAADERENGIRKTLNFGHTLGHAIEHASEYRLLHGEAVAIGMYLEARLAEGIGVAARGLAARIATALAAARLPPELPPGMTADAIVAATRADKKARGGRIEYSLPCRIGSMAGGDVGWTLPVTEDDVRAMLRSAAR